MDRRVARVLLAITAILSTFVAASCERKEPARSYPLRGQVLSVHPDKNSISIRHEDIEGFMPGMTMTFPVASPELLKGREPGELIYATLEVTDALGRLTKIERTGFSALPADSNAAAIPGNLLSEGDALPDAAFIDQQDRRRAMSEWRGSITLITFIYTRCPLPNYCPLMDRNFATIQNAIAADAALKDKVRLVTLSFDPDYDTPAVLLAHAKKLKADPAIWTFLTGDRPTMDKFAAKLGVGLTRPEGVQDITHNLRTTLVGADGRILRIYTGNEWTPSKAIEDIRAAARQP